MLEGGEQRWLRLTTRAIARPTAAHPDAAKAARKRPSEIPEGLFANGTATAL
jgi:hypothetical protein